MTLDIAFKENYLLINGKSMKFDFEVGNAFVVNNNIIFLLRIPNGNPTIQNIYCLNENLQFAWQVQSMLEAFTQLGEELPFEGMHLKDDGNISAYDFFGRTFEIDSKNGKILNYQVSR